MRSGLWLSIFASFIVFAGPSHSASAADWPMWRYDAGRTASSPADLPADLNPIWTREYAPRVAVWDDPLNQDLMPYDEILEPVVLGKTLFLNFNDTDKLVAFDTDTGQERWRYYADGPIRLPAVAANGKVWFAGDDGYLYCLNAETGEQLWKFRGGPSDRKLLGNERLISTWPARGGPVLVDNTIYFAASIWPFMGTFIYALDAETGRVTWVNDSTSAQFIDQPHNYPAFAGVAPQGPLAATADKLLIPGGRSIPACFDRLTGKFLYFHLARYGKSGGSAVFAHGNSFFGHEREDKFSRFDIETGEVDIGARGKRPVLSDDGLFFSGESIIKRAPKEPRRTVWEAPVNASGDLIRAGNRLYAANGDTITVLTLGPRDEPPTVEKVITARAGENEDIHIARLIAADDKLFAVTREGDLLAYGASAPNAKIPTLADDTAEPAAVPDVQSQAKRILDETNVRDGYALFYGVGDGQLLEALATESNLHLVAVDPDAAKINRLRRQFDAQGLYGERIALMVGDIESLVAPQYLSSLTVVYDTAAAGLSTKPDSIQRIYESLRPYGGTAWLNVTGSDAVNFVKAAESAGLPQGKWASSALGDHATLIRPGALPGSGVWTHQYGNISNTVKSDDQLVKLPLGILWFGGSSNMDVLPRHGHGPPEQVIAGRLIIQGMESISARDVYTGRVLWKVPLKRDETFGMYYDETYKDTPTSTQYNQVHIPGANARGTNFVATEDRVYIIQGPECLVLDAATGKQLAVFSLPDSADGRKAESWGYIGVYEDALIAGEGFAEFTEKLGLPAEKKDSRSKYRFVDYDKSASDALVIMDRKSGEVRWRIEAKHGFIHNAVAVADGVLYALDKLPPGVEQKLARRGKAHPETYRLVALDMQTGQPRWETSENIFGTWLSVSREHNILLQSTRPSSDTVQNENGTRMIAYRADTGDVLWDKPISYGTPPILHGDRIIAGGRMFHLKTGETIERVDPITGIKAPWSYVSTKGCNYPVACENLITFRSSSAAFFDLSADGGTGHFGGFKSGCTSNLVAADGVLNAPDYTRTCTCSFQNQTSLALVHMPELEMWTHNDFSYDGQRVKQAGVNFGAPGDRRANDGTLWMEYPSVGGPSPDIAVRVDGQPRWFRHHSSRIDGEGETWVAASGVEGAARVIVRVNPSPIHLLETGLSVAEGVDDGIEDEKGTVTLDTPELTLAGDETPCTFGLRFTGVPLPQGAKVKAAWIQFESSQKAYARAPQSITAQAADNAPPFKTATKDFSARPKTDASVTWNIKQWPKRGEIGPDQRTNDLTAVVQEVVNRPGWKPGNAMAFFVTGTGRHAAAAFEGDPKGAPALCVELEDPSAAVDAAGKADARPYTVRLVFVEPDESTKPGDRVFDVTLGDRPMLRDFDIVSEAGKPLRMLVKEFPGVPIAHELAIRFEPKSSRPAILCGVELMAE